MKPKGKSRLHLHVFLALIAVSCANANRRSSASSPVENANRIDRHKICADEDVAHERKQTYINTTLHSNSRNLYSELIRLKEGVKPDEGIIRGGNGLAALNQRRDAADFRLPALLTILYHYSTSELLDPQTIADAKEAVLGFKYWPDELADWNWRKTPQMDSAYIYQLLRDDDPSNDAIARSHQAAFERVDEMDDMCYWSENHYILFSSGAYLAAQLYPRDVFTASGETGVQRMRTFKPRIMKWLELRYQSGFSEWLSNVYYNEDMPALLALIELCEDPAITQPATMVLDLMMADMALNSFRGSFGSTHGRTYENKMSGCRDHTRSVSNLMFGLNDASVGNMTASLLAVSEKYRLPPVIYEIANDTQRRELVNTQRMGITIDEHTLCNWGLDSRPVEEGGDIENAMTLLTLEAYAHPRTIELFRNMLDSYCLWGNKFFAPFKEARLLIEHPELLDTITGMSTGATTLPELAELAKKDVTRNMRPEVNLYTYRTPDYMLSTAQDYRPGYGGDQQSIWQATLGPEAVCFTTHPARKGDSSAETPNYWTGYGTLPRAIQIKNVVISLYDIDTTTQLYVKDQLRYTHAYLPKGKFAESARQTAGEGVWFFARKGRALLALFSSDKKSDWEDNADDAEKSGPYEIIANGRKTIWICELARLGEEFPDFRSFQKAIWNAPLNVDPDSLTVNYISPSQGILAMDWNSDVTQNGVPVQVNAYKRYDNCYATAAFPAGKIAFRCKGHSLTLDFRNGTRQVINADGPGLSRAR